MTIAIPQPLTLETFLTLPYIEESPAWEFIQGEAIQKPIPGGKHSRLQSRLGGAINTVDSSYEALPELRCTFGGRSIVPDLVVLVKQQIPVDADGEIISEKYYFYHCKSFSHSLHSILCVLCTSAVFSPQCKVQKGKIEKRY